MQQLRPYVPLAAVAVIQARKAVDLLGQQAEIAWAIIRGNTAWRALLDLDTSIDIAYVTVSCLAIWGQWELHSNGELDVEKPFISLFSAAAWLRMIYGCRGETWCGPRLLPMIAALNSTVDFFVVTLMSLMAATHAYYALKLRSEPSPEYAAFSHMARFRVMTIERHLRDS